MIKTKPKNSKIEIDLTGPGGNAYSLLANAERFARDLGLDEKKILEEMQSGDYNNLVEVFDREFGSFVVLYR